MTAELPSKMKKVQGTPTLSNTTTTQTSLKKKQQIKTLKQRALEYELGKLKWGFVDSWKGEGLTSTANRNNGCYGSSRYGRLLFR